MRKTTLLLSVALTAALGIGVAVRSRTATEPVQASRDHGRIVETGALYRFAPPREAPPLTKKEGPAAAISLTSSDGTGLKLASIDARGVIQGPLAFTELRLVFDNPEDRALEGTFRIALPQGGAISRFAMKQGALWQEGEVVEKQRARQAYEDFLHRRQDPALLEQAAGNEFSARVFPIPARGRKELIVSYSQEVTPEAPYAVLLRGLPVVGKLDAVVSRSGDDAPVLGQIHLENAAPSQDLLVESSRLPPGDGVRAGELALLRVRPAAEAGQDAVGSAVVMVDTSASRALGFEAQIDLVARACAGLGQAPLVVAAFDQGIDVIYEGPASGFAEAGAAKLRERQALGASDLEAALDWARIRAKAARARRVILVTDGVPTVGVTEPAKLREAALALKSGGVERIDALAVGGIRDDATLRGLCTAGLARDGVVIDGAKGPEQAVRRLSSATRTVSVKVEGAEWQWPEKLEGFQPGDEALVYAKIAPGLSPKLSLAGAPTEVKLAEIDRPLLERAWVSAKIAQLVQKPPAGKSDDEVKEEIVRLSTGFRVLSPHTALLVLESEADYARYKIDRKALADILTVEGTALVRKKRSDEVALGGQPAMPAKNDPPSDGVVLTAPAAPPGAMAASPPPPPAMDMAPGAAPPPAMAAAPARDTSAGKPGPAARANAAQLNDELRELDAHTIGALAAPPASAGPGPGDLGSPTSPPAFGQGTGGAGALKARGGAWPMPHSGGLAGGGAGRRPSGAEHEPMSGPGAFVRAAIQGTKGDFPNADRVLASARARARGCYQQGLHADPSMQGRARLVLAIAPGGKVSSVQLGASGSLSGPVMTCVKAALQRTEFDTVRGGSLWVWFSFVPQSDPTTEPSAAFPAWPSPLPAGAALDPAPLLAVARPPQPPPPPSFGPYEGELAVVMELLSKGDRAQALDRAVAFRNRAPGDVLALLSLGEVFEAMGETRSAARAYGSLIDLFSSRADLRRMAGERLERLSAPYAQSLAADSYEKAVTQRPDHPSGHRLLAYARLKAQDYAGAFDAIEAGAKRSYPPGRFPGVDRILKEDMGLIAAAWTRAEPRKSQGVKGRLEAAGARLEEAPSVRFVMMWETDNNDVDFHIHDHQGGHAYYSQKQLRSGGELYADVTTGYGPECFTVPGPPEGRAGPYRLEAHYYSRGPMGYGMGKLEIIDHDGKGGLTFDERPFVIMQDHAFVPLGNFPAGGTVETSKSPALPAP